jgi:hypothetical protein
VFLVFLAALPLVNALFDWLSLGLTRVLLRQSLERRRPGIALRNGGIDVLAALGLLAALAVAATAGLQGLNRLALAGGWPAPLIDLGDLLRRLRETPGDPSVWWIYATLVSTLLPSVVHLAIAGGAFVQVRWPRAWNDRYAARLTPAHLAFAPTRYKLAGYLTLRQATEWLCPLLVLALVVALLWAWGLALPEVARGLLWLAETVALALGVDVTPGPVFQTLLL